MRMSFGETVLLGALAGFTIFLGLPVARMQVLGPRARVGMAMFAVGVLAFLLVDVMEHAFEIVEEAVEEFADDAGSLGESLGLALLLCAGFTAGTAGLGFLEARLRARESTPPPIAGASPELAAGLTVEDAVSIDPEAAVARTRALRTGMTIAAAIGLHNFAEGLAIGVSANAGEISLATVLIIGFALHNATEGFGIVGPLGSITPSWRWLLVAGFVGGAPVFVGSIVGYNVTSEPLELAFYGLAAGAILYVIGEVWSAMRRYGHRQFGLWLLATGFFVGIATDLIVVYGGG
jgi:ZIP family zinc transporter